MASSWQVRYANSSGNWSSWSDIDNPTNNLTVTQKSTRNKHILYDGSIGRTVPNTKYNYEEVDIEWSFISGSSVLILNSAANASSLSLPSIVSAAYKIELKTHTLEGSDTQTWQGYIIEYPRMYKLGLYPTSTSVYETFYDISIKLDLISVT